MTHANLLKQWRDRAISGQTEARRVLAEMLTPSGGARSNCYKFISWVTGCSHSTIGRVNEQMKETGKSRTLFCKTNESELGRNFCFVLTNFLPNFACILNKLCNVRWKVQQKFEKPFEISKKIFCFEEAKWQQFFANAKENTSDLSHRKLKKKKTNVCVGD